MTIPQRPRGSQSRRLDSNHKPIRGPDGRVQPCSVTDDYEDPGFATTKSWRERTSGPCNLVDARIPTPAQSPNGEAKSPRACPGAPRLRDTERSLWTGSPREEHTYPAMAGMGTAPSTRGQGRRLAAAWFSDVVGSTEVAEELGDRRFGWLIDRYFAIARSALRRHGGREIGTAGDSMFAIFDAPGAALRAAFEATAAVRDVGLEIRSGVHFGEVEHDAGGSVGGIALHIGSRVVSLAGQGEVLTTATTAELAKGAGFRFEDRGTHALKGIADSQGIFAVVEMDGEQAQLPLEPDDAAGRRKAAIAEAGMKFESHLRTPHSVTRAGHSSDAPGSSMRSRRPPEEAATGHGSTFLMTDRVVGGPRSTRGLVGRDAERDLIADAVNRVAEGSGTALLLSGEVGMGKTSLARQGLEMASARGFETLEGRCQPLDQGLAYTPIIEAFGRFLRACQPSHRAQLVLYLPALGRLFEGLDLPLPDPLGDAALEKTRLFEAVLRLLARMATEAPVAILLDDLHWADTASLELLSYVSRELTFLPVLLISTRRPEKAEPPSPAFRALLESLRRTDGAREIVLESLSQEDVEVLLARLLEGTPSPGAAELIAHRSGGVPLFVEAFLRWLLDTHGLVESGGNWSLAGDGESGLPPMVRDVIVGRLERLPPAERHVLDLIAVGGEHTTSTVLAGVVDLSVDLASALAGLSHTGLVVEETERGVVTYRFDHPLMHEVSYEEIPGPQRRGLHLRFAEAFERSGDVAELAAHYLAAGPEVDPGRAADVLLAAGREALARYAAEEARRFFESALPAAERARPDLVGEILLGLGEAWFRAGRLSEAVRVWRSALQLDPRFEDPVRRAHLYRLMATAESHRGDVVAAEQDIEAGLASLQRVPPCDEHVELLWVRMMTAARQLRLDEVLGAERRLQETAREVSTLRARGLASVATVTALLERADYVALLAAARDAELGRVLEELGDAELLRRREDIVGVVAAALGDLPVLRDVIRRGLELGREFGLPAWSHRTHLYAFVEAFYTGDWDRAWEVIHEAASVAEKVDNPRIAAFVPTMGAMLAAYQADFEAADDRLATGSALLQRGPLRGGPGTAVLANIVGALVALEQQDASTALELIQRNEDRFAQGILPPWGLVALGEARAKKGKTAEARHTIARLASLGPDGTYPPTMAARLEGLVRLTEGRWQEGAQSLRQSRDGFARLGMPFEVARVTIEAGEAIGGAAPDDLRSLTSELADAHRTATRLGAKRYVGRSARLLRAAGVRIPRFEPSAGEALTPRQLEVAELVAKGLANPEIAEHLYLSVRTVTSHLDHIYTKLGISSRAALAAYVTKLRDHAPR
jgi:class 3 adenylate cyclase/DNA-binding CsgD family transcriptional regulator/tetratricopeptide (TPR) repeat protein